MLLGSKGILPPVIHGFLRTSWSSFHSGRLRQTSTGRFAPKSLHSASVGADIRPLDVSPPKSTKNPLTSSVMTMSFGRNGIQRVFLRKMAAFLFSDQSFWSYWYPAGFSGFAGQKIKNNQKIFKKIQKSLDKPSTVC